MYRRLAWLWIVALAALLLAASCSESTSPGATPHPETGLRVAPQADALAPDFELIALDGRATRLSDLRGRPVLLNFWATWCPACVQEMPHIEAAFEEKRGDGLVVLAVNVGEGKARVEQFVRERGLTFTVLLDYHGNVAQTYGIRFFPTSFLIDRQGIIRLVKAGAFVSRASLLDVLEGVM